MMLWFLTNSLSQSLLIALKSIAVIGGSIWTLTIDGVAHRGVYAEKMESFAEVLDRIQHELDMENLHIV